MARLTVDVTERDHVRGPARAAVTLLEYGDYQCPFCGQSFWVLKNLEARFARDLRFAFRHFPLTELHPFAVTAAEAAEAASDQGKFWQMHDTLFENQSTLDPQSLFEFATELHLDIDQFSDDVATHRHAERIREDFRRGVRSGVTGTPSFFINGERYDGPAEETMLSHAIEAARRGHHVERH